MKTLELFFTGMMFVGLFTILLSLLLGFEGSITGETFSCCFLVGMLFTFGGAILTLSIIDKQTKH